MLLAIDIGNTNTTLGLYEEERLLFTSRLATDKTRTEDQYAIEICDVMKLNGYEAKAIEDAIICSVVPQVCASVSNAISKLCNIVPLILGPGVRTGLNIRIDDPAQLGADLAAGAVGALAEYTMPCIVIDLGTATTISVLDKNGAFLGGVIAAGIGLTLEALTSKTAQLPSVHIEPPPSVIGKNTADCMKSGLVFGAAAMLDGMIEHIEAELGEKAAIVATGGRAKQIVSCCKREIILNENLLLDGLRIIYEKNNRH